MDEREDMKQEQDEKVCQTCGKKGGRMRIDPYQLELYGIKVKIRVHDGACLQDRYDAI